MGGNPKLRDRGEQEPETFLRLEGPIHQLKCWIEIGIANPFGAKPDFITSMRALIDTGATGSAISVEGARSLGLQPRTKIKVGLGSGERLCDAAPATFFVHHPDGGWLRRSINMVILPMDIIAVVGMTELCNGRFVLDGPAMTWRWTVPRTSIRARLP